MKSAILMVVIAAAVPAAAQAQARRAAPPPRPTIAERGFIGINGVYQVGSNDFRDSSTIQVNAESGRFNTDYAVGSGPAFDVSGAGVVWRNLAVGVGVTRFSTSTTTAIDASVPHPFFFNQPREVTGQYEGSRQELAVHVQLRGLFPVNDRVLVTIFGGPSFFKVDQDIVSDFDYTESYPFDTATFSRAIASSQSDSAVGINIGGDVAYFFSPQAGVGVSIMYTHATAQMTLPSGTADVKAGSAQIGGGLRLRF